MDTNQSEQHFFLSKMPTQNIITTPAQYPCTVIGSSKPSSYTNVPNIMSPTNNMTLGTYNTKYPIISVDNNSLKLAQTTTYNALTQPPNDCSSDIKFIMANNNFKTAKKVFTKRNCTTGASQKPGDSSNDNVTVAPNQLTILVQEVLPAQLPDNHPTNTAAATAATLSSSTSMKAQTSAPTVISNAETQSISSEPSSVAKPTLTQQNSQPPPQPQVQQHQHQPVADDTKDSICTVIKEVLCKAVSGDAHEDVFLSVIKARENGTIGDLELEIQIPASSPNTSNTNSAIVSTTAAANADFGFIKSESIMQQHNNLQQPKMEPQTNSQKFYSPTFNKPQFVQNNNFQVVQKPMENHFSAATPLPQPIKASNTNKRRTGSTNSGLGGGKASGAKKQKMSAGVAADSGSLLLEKQSLQRCQAGLSKLGVPSFRKLVHEPRLSHNSLPDLLPLGSRSRTGHNCHKLGQLQDNCVKYRRLPFTLSQPNPIRLPDTIEATGSSGNSNNFILQNLNAFVPEGALLSSKDSEDYIDCIIAPSPVAESDYLALLDGGETGSNSGAGGPNLEMLRPPRRAQSPVLSAYQPPAQQHQQTQLHLQHHTQPHSCLSKTAPGASSRSTLFKPTEVSFVHESGVLSPATPLSSAAAQIDSETGEVVNKIIQESRTTKDKLLVTFTLSPADDVEKTVKHITDMLGIDYSSIAFKLTTSGGEISFDKNSMGPKFKSELAVLPREFTERYGPSVLTTPTPSSSAGSSHDLVTSSRGLCDQQQQHQNPPQQSQQQPQQQPMYTEKVYKSAQLISRSLSSQSSTQKCSNCEKPLIISSANCDINTTKPIGRFCDESCQLEYGSNNNSGNEDDTHSSSLNNHTNTNGGNSSHNKQDQLKEQYLFIGEDVRDKLVIVQGTMAKLKQMTKHRAGIGISADKFPASRSKKASPNKTPVIKLFKGTKYNTFEASQAPTVLYNSSVVSEIQFTRLCASSSAVLRNRELIDKRLCCLCGRIGDDKDQGLGRLIPVLRPAEWAHSGCLVWCDGVVELASGALLQVAEALAVAHDLECSQCGLTGAGLVCGALRCGVAFHLPCARSTGAQLSLDRSVLCPGHTGSSVTDVSIEVDRRVFVQRDEAALVAAAINDERDEDDERQHHAQHQQPPHHKSVLRVGSLTVLDIGQLHPHQMHSGHFHNLSHVYPVGFHSLRVHWSSRRLSSRAVYDCQIRLKNDRPLFRVSARDPGLPDVVHEASSCTGAWTELLAQCHSLRRAHGVINLFPEHMRGEDLFGLTDPFVLRAIESLPGLSEGLYDYAFKFGKVELLTRMPLPINASGSMRTETFMRQPLHGHGQHQKSVIHQSPNFARHPAESSNQPVSRSASLVSKWQQYSRLRTESRLNVTLRRSKVQGLGLFAARDIEKGTMMIEYIGELIRNEVANRREADYESRHRGIYMFRLDVDTVIDASRAGELARYINHSCEPNCHTEQLQFDKEAHIVIIASRKIERGEELSYDYKFDLQEESDNCAASGDKIPCLCGARNCRRWMN